jgi:hypothetical protein
MVLKLSACRHLIKRIFAMTEDTLDEQRPSQGDAFVGNDVRLIKPKELESHDPTWSWSWRGSDVWDMLCAALTGDVEAIDKLIRKDANLVKAEYWYTQPLHFAVREGHLAAVQALLDAGGDPTFVKYNSPDLNYGRPRSGTRRCGCAAWKNADRAARRVRRTT